MVSIINKLKNLQQLGLMVVIIAMCIIASLLSPVFLTTQNLLNILTQATMSGLAALGVCMILLVGEIDLSIGSMMAACGIAAITVGNATGSVVLAVIAGIVMGIIITTLNATIVLKLGVIPFITTLGMMQIARGAVMVFTNAASVQVNMEGFDFIGLGYIWEIPFPIIILVVLAFFVYFIIVRTPLGRQIYAVGSNRDAARLSGINVTKIKYIVYIFEGAFVSIAALVMASRLNTGQPLAGTGFELQVISAVILGGVSMSGGRGKLSGALLGVLILTILNNALVLLNVSSFYQQIARGIVLIVAVFFDERRRISINRTLLKDMS